MIYKYVRQLVKCTAFFFDTSQLSNRKNNGDRHLRPLLALVCAIDHEDQYREDGTRIGGCKQPSVLIKSDECQCFGEASTVSAHENDLFLRKVQVCLPNFHHECLIRGYHIG